MAMKGFIGPQVGRYGDNTYIEQVEESEILIFKQFFPVPCASSGRLDESARLAITGCQNVVRCG